MNTTTTEPISLGTMADELLTELEKQVCSCTRPRFPIHCRVCGSRVVYAKQANTIRLMEAFPEVNPTVIETLRDAGVLGLILPTNCSRGFRCLRCGLNFHEFTTCKAPTPIAKGRIQRQSNEPTAKTEPDTIVIKQKELSEAARALASGVPQKQVLAKLFAGQPPLSKR